MPIAYRLLGGFAGNQEMELSVQPDRQALFRIYPQDIEVPFRICEAELTRLKAAFDEVGFSDLPSLFQAKGGPIIDAPDLVVTYEGKGVREKPGVDSALAPVR